MLTLNKYKKIATYMKNDTDSGNVLDLLFSVLRKDALTF